MLKTAWAGKPKKRAPQKRAAPKRQPVRQLKSKASSKAEPRIRTEVSPKVLTAEGWNLARQAAAQQASAKKSKNS